MSIRLRLTLFYSGLMMIALVLFSVLLYGVLRWTFIQTVDDNLRDVAVQVARAFETSRRLPPLDRMTDRSTFVQVRVQNQVLTSRNFEGEFPLPAGAERGEASYIDGRDKNGEPYRLYTLPVLVNEEEAPLFYVQVASAVALVDKVNSRLLPLLIAGMLSFLLLSAFGAWVVAGRAVKPIEGVARAAEAVGESADLSLRVPYEGPPDEVGRLVTTFNAMLDQLQALYARLAASIDAQQRFVADASHELRTPLTIIRGNIDYLQRAGALDPEAMADMASEAERMTRLVEELLTMARTDAGQSPELEPVALGPLVHEACRKGQAMPHSVEFHTELPEALDRVMILGHSEWLRRALLILIDNAFKYTAAGRVTVRAGRQGEGVVVQVVDTGIGIAQEDLPHIFERFYRADRARSRGGTGLGLAIARWVAGLHGGHLSVESELGKGSTFSLWLPILKA